MDGPGQRANKPDAADPPAAAIHSSSPKATPKRKRDEPMDGSDYFSVSAESSVTKSPMAKPAFSFELPGASDSNEDGASSPRTHVAHKFRNLALDGPSGGGVTTTSGISTNDNTTSITEAEASELAKAGVTKVIFGFDGTGYSTAPKGLMFLDEEDESSTRKRMRLPMVESDIISGPVAARVETSEAGAALPESESETVTAQVAIDPQVTNKGPSVSSGGLRTSFPSINRLSDSKSRSRKRSGTPPLSTRRKPSESITEEEEDMTIVDPIRAALTWREDEITVYDAQDKDDDGIGLNGIGFRPTPAVAYARAQKRRQQLSEYKKREESEARARRNFKRREQLGGPSELERQHSVVKVHFSEAEPSAVVIT
jgi:hypothetical protein